MATYFSILAWGIPKARGDWWTYRSSGGNELEKTEQLNQQQRHIPDRNSEDTRNARENSQPRQSERKCLDSRAELFLKVDTRAELLYI